MPNLVSTKPDSFPKRKRTRWLEKKGGGSGKSLKLTTTIAITSALLVDVDAILFQGEWALAHGFGIGFGSSLKV